MKSHFLHFSCKHTHTHSHQLAIKYSRTVRNDPTCNAWWCCSTNGSGGSADLGCLTYRSTSRSWYSLWVCLQASAPTHSLFPLFSLSSSLLLKKIMEGQLSSICLLKCKDFGGGCGEKKPGWMFPPTEEVGQQRNEWTFLQFLLFICDTVQIFPFIIYVLLLCLGRVGSGNGWTSGFTTGTYHLFCISSENRQIIIHISCKKTSSMTEDM